MAERRSLGAALDLTPEKRAFIQGGPPVTPNASAVAKTEVPAAQTIDQNSDEPESERAKSERSVRRSRSRRQARAPLPREDQALLGIANLLMPLTTRLQPSTAAALKRAGLEQKLRGQSPSTVQEIAEEAIQDWLRDYGYLQ